MRRAGVVLALALAGCASGPSAEERDAEARRNRALAVGFLGEPPLSPLWGREPATGGFTSSRQAFDMFVDAPRLAETPETFIRPDAPADVVAAAAMALGFSKSDATEGVLVGLALRPSHPPETVEALFSYYRMRGADKQPPATLPDAKLLAYADHPDARGRAALGHLGRVIKDPALLPAMERLAKDADWEVRRAVALALANGPEKSPRTPEDSSRCVEALKALVKDADAHVAASACRAMASYDSPVAAEALVYSATHEDFNVRVAALEGMGRRKKSDHGELALLELLARTDPSTSVRYAAAVQLAAINAGAAQKLVDGLLADANEYVRSGAAEVLAKSEDLTAPVRLASIAKSDKHVRVRETAVGAFEGKKDSQIAKDAIAAALEDKDPVVVATACGVAAKNEWKEMADALMAIPPRFPGCAGADAREGAVSAVADLDGAARRAWIEAFLTDANPGVRAAAAKAIATIDKQDPPKPASRGADLTGELLPGGAPIFDKDAFLVVETNKGTMKIRLFHDQAPVHCAHVASLAMKGFYDGLTWHRVVPDFVIQGACPRGDGSGNAGVTLPLEPTRIPFERGTLGMPRSDHLDTGGCQLFICHSRAPHLDVRYTAFGKVVLGLDVIDRIDVDDKILHVRVEGAR